MGPRQKKTSTQLMPELMASATAKARWSTITFPSGAKFQGTGDNLKVFKDNKGIEMLRLDYEFNSGRDQGEEADTVMRVQLYGAPPYKIKVGDTHDYSVFDNLGFLVQTIITPWWTILHCCCSKPKRYKIYDYLDAVEIGKVQLCCCQPTIVKFPKDMDPRNKAALIAFPIFLDLEDRDRGREEREERRARERRQGYTRSYDDD